MTREECEEVGGLWGFGWGVSHGREWGSGRNMGFGMRKNESLDGEREGDLPGGCLLRRLSVFQIQTFDPELWVWGRDRTLLP